jgi:hypothetical protein
LEDLEQINPFYPGWLSRIHSTTRIWTLRSSYRWLPLSV